VQVLRLEHHRRAQPTSRAGQQPPPVRRSEGEDIAQAADAHREVRFYEYSVDAARADQIRCAALQTHKHHFRLKHHPLLILHHLSIKLSLLTFIWFCFSVSKSSPR
jgi:hypothetical protein